jgi:glyoxylase-like metal-dependent hydrolase (beta-lactamase superfamily II)
LYADSGLSDWRPLAALPGVWHCKQDLTPVFPGEWSAINVIVGERIVIVDSGMPGGDALVWPVLESLGRPPTDIVAIVNTHWHGDYTGSNGALRDRTGAQIMIHALDSSPLGSGELEGPTAGPADVHLEDGSRIDLGDCELQVVHLPGHTPGSIGVLLPSEGALFTDDSLQARGTGVQFIASYADPPAYVASVRKAMQLDVQHLVPAHALVARSSGFLTSHSSTRSNWTRSSPTWSGPKLTRLHPALPRACASASATTSQARWLSPPSRPT